MVCEVGAVQRRAHPGETEKGSVPNLGGRHLYGHLGGGEGSPPVTVPGSPGAMGLENPGPDHRPDI